ncbi:glycosyltransferase family 2 protein [Pseudoalteromonas sp. XMcav2-N-2]|uniref:glycosyltransferase family 2 protein n=1 Tax=unclassified Pseudoalteromonas TaxID=194690 RepID=UPI002098116E|nr:glycosyltransferase [Pseudoalteromonas sp. XMcav2-N]
MSNSKVSIIMPCFNSSAYISESIESVLAQSHTDWELIIVDDKSKDESVEIIERFMGDVRIKLIKNEVNRGGAGSRNKAIEVATGRYIAFLDSDDLWEPTKLEKQIAYMTREGIGFSYTNYTQFRDGDDADFKITAPQFVDYKMLIKSNFIGCLTVVYDVSEHGKFYFPETKKRHDFALWLNMLRKFHEARNVGLDLARYRVHNASLSSNKKDAFQSYFHVLHRLQNISYVSALFKTFFFAVLTVIKKKAPNLYPMFLKLYIPRARLYERR